jgi:hypothetical protein
LKIEGVERMRERSRHTSKGELTVTRYVRQASARSRSKEMIREVPAKKEKTSRETVIEDDIIAHPDKLGFPGALAIRNFRIADTSGAIDVVLLPQTGSPLKLVLAEAKAASAHDAGSKVIGQLLMYYQGALELGSDGICALRKFALASPSVAHSLPRISPQKVMGGLRSNAECFKALSMGSRLTPRDVALFIAER